MELIVKAILDYNKWSVYIGMFMGWLLGFVQYAAVAGAPQCTPQLVYSLESSVLVYYQVPFAVGDPFYASDMIVNALRLTYHLFGSVVSCADLWLSMFGPMYPSYQFDSKVLPILQEIFKWSNYFLFVV